MAKLDNHSVREYDTSSVRFRLQLENDEAFIRFTSTTQQQRNTSKNCKSDYSSLYFHFFYSLLQRILAFQNPATEMNMVSRTDVEIWRVASDDSSLSCTCKPLEQLQNDKLKQVMCKIKPSS